MKDGSREKSRAVWIGTTGVPYKRREAIIIGASFYPSGNLVRN